MWLDREGIDPSLFFDDDGKTYYTRHQGMADGSIAQCEIDLKAGKLLGELKEVWRGTGGVWPEGPHLYKFRGKYYLTVSEGGTSYGHMVTVARIESPMGPFEPCPRNPILTHANRPDHPIQAVGHADLVETPAGWWAVCLGIRPQGGRFHTIGRETMLAPVTWSDDGWPSIGDDGRIELEMPAPKLPPHPWPAEQTRDDFDSPELDLAWNFLRNPHDGDWSLTERPGFLRLRGSAVTMSDQDSSAFVGRRQTALSFAAETLLSFEPQQENEEAGLTLRGNDANHVDLGVTLRDGRRKLFLRKVLDGKIAEPIQFVDVPPGDLTLSVGASQAESLYRFAASYGSGKDETMLLLGTAGNLPTRDLASEAIGGFTGVYIGMYATGNGKPSTTPTDFAWFDYQILEP